MTLHNERATAAFTPSNILAQSIKRYIEARFQFLAINVKGMAIVMLIRAGDAGNVIVTAHRANGEVNDDDIVSIQ